MHKPEAEIAPTAARSNFALWIALGGIALLLLVGTLRLLDADDPFHALVVTMTVGYVLWIVSEFRITSGDASKDTRHDSGTCERYAIARFITMLAAYGFAPVWTGYGLWLPIGFAVFLAGIALRVWAIRTLGRFYSHRVRMPGGVEPDEATIVRSGPYRVLRHPAYSGMLLAHVGVMLLFFNWFVVIALAAIFVPALVLRIRVEEAALLQIPAYREFAASRARLLPGVW